MASPPSPGRASLERAIALASRGIFSVQAVSTTVILFWVRVPVLSEQMISVQPSVSTADILRMTAPRFDILVTPIESSMVTTAASPSGIAATARLMAMIKVSSTTSHAKLPLKMPLAISWKAKIKPQMPSTM